MGICRKRREEKQGLYIFRKYNIDKVAWYKVNAKYFACPTVYESMKANELGIYNMSGNVMEWVRDTYAAYPNLPQTNPVITTTNNVVVSGGSWYDEASSCTVAYRTDIASTYYSLGIGFRIAKVK